MHRSYLKTPDGLRRLPHRMLFGKELLPQFANMTLPEIDIMFSDGEIYRLVTGYLRLDASGAWDRKFSAIAGMVKRITADALKKAKENQVTDLTHVRVVQADRAKYEYKLSPAELDEIIADTIALKRKSIPILRNK